MKISVCKDCNGNDLYIGDKIRYKGETLEITIDCRPMFYIDSDFDVPSDAWMVVARNNHWNINILDLKQEWITKVE